MKKLVSKDQGGGLLAEGTVSAEVEDGRKGEEAKGSQVGRARSRKR